MFKIMGKYNGRTEEIDSFETQAEAEKMLSEYQMAYGHGWQLWIKK